MWPGDAAVRVLVVDDEPYVAELIQQTLESEGHRCITAACTDEAGRAIEAGGVEAMTLDLCMPGGRAVGWLETLAGDHPDLARRTLVVSGSNVTARDRERIEACGAGFLAKPFRLERLKDAFRGQIASSKAD
jgi:DNA-binding NtrC family response regulator